MEEHEKHEHKSHEHKSHHEHQVHHSKPKLKIKKTVIWQSVSIVLLIALIVSINTCGFKSCEAGDSTVPADITTSAEGTLKAIIINDDRCEKCDTSGLKMQLKQTFDSLEIQEIDYSKKQAKDLYKSTGLAALPAVLFNEDIKDQENYDKVKQFIEEKGDYFSLKVGGSFDPEAEICDNEKDDTGNGKVDCEDPGCKGEWKCMEKRETPKVEAFVMSHCPFGTQIEKGLLPVVELIEDKIDFEIKFVNYAMHGEKEVNEQLNQYCIQEEQTDKLVPYLKCFLESGKGEECLTETGIDMDKLESCTKAADEEFAVTENLEDKSKWSGGRFPRFLVHDAENQKYGVRGSPALVINGVTASTGRDPASLLDAVCTGFTEKPEECNEELSSANPSSGFGFDAASSSTGGGCGV